MKKQHAKHAGAKAAESSPREGRPSTRKQRMTASLKQLAARRVIHREEVELVARSFGVSAADVSGWREMVMTASISRL